MFCNRCGHENPARSRFCSSCGAGLESANVDETTASYAPVSSEDAPSLDDLTADSGLLVVHRGPNAGSRYLLDQDLIRIGRHPEADILLDDVTVSRGHAEIRRTSDGYEVQDDGSLNGTYLNGKRVDDAPLRNGDELQIGKYRLVFYGNSSQVDVAS